MMFGWSKKEKNDVVVNKTKAELAGLSQKEKGERLSKLRKKYPHRLNTRNYNFVGELFDTDLIFLYMLLNDQFALTEADLIDDAAAEAAIVDEPVEAVVATEAEAASPVADDPAGSQESFDSSTPVEDTPRTETSSFDSDSRNDGGGYDSGDSFDSGGDDGGGDCGGD